MSARTLIAVGLTLSVTAATTNAQTRTFHGKITGVESWSGTVRLDGDVEVAESGQLSIQPGTRVLMGNDGANLGWVPGKVEIHVKGSFSVGGTKDQPVFFEAAQGSDDGGHGLWHGIVVHPPKDKKADRLVRGAVIKHAWSGLQIPSGGLLVDGCVFRACTVGIEVGSAFASRDVRGVRGGAARPRIASSRFTGCTTGIYAEWGGVPAINRCAFYRNGTAVGNARPGVSSPLRDPGTVSQQCDFIENGKAVFGPAVVMNSLFTGNEVALAPSRFHSVYDTNMDCLSYAANLFHDNGTLIDGESAAGDGLVGRDPLRTGPLDALGGDWPPLPAALRLRQGSPGIGAATHGGDLGPLGADRRTAGKVAWKTTRDRAPELHVLAMPGSLKARARKRFPVTARKSSGRPGAKVGRGWWSVTKTEADGSIPLRRLFRGPDARGWVGLTFETPEACQLEVEINGDLNDAIVMWNKRMAKELTTPRRWHTEGLLLTLDCKEGVNVLVVEVAPRSGDARLGIATRCSGTLTRSENRNAGALTVTRARLVSKNGARMIEVKTKQPINWIHDGVRDLFVIKDGRDARLRERLPVRVTGPKQLLIGPILDRFNGPLTLTDAKLTKPDGEPYEGLEKTVSVRGSGR